jgi:acetyl esterase/lipase
MMDFLSCYAPESEWKNPYIAPVYADLKDLPPVLLHTAELDVLRDEGLELGQKLSEHGVQVTSKTFEGVPHGFFSLKKYFPRQANQSVEDLAVWIKSLPRSTTTTQ